MKKIVLMILSCMIVEAGDFISDFEYGQMLYDNPRGVSCVPCHGRTGKGKRIVSYRDKSGKKIHISGPDITDSTLEDIKLSIREGRGVMPRYFLTDEEAETIYKYIQKVNPKPVKKSGKKKSKR